MQPVGSEGGPECFAALLLSSEGSKPPPKGRGTKAIIWKASFSVPNLHLHIIRMEGWEKSPQESGELPRSLSGLGEAAVRAAC